MGCNEPFACFAGVCAAPIGVLSAAIALLDGGEVNFAVASDDASDYFANFCSCAAVTYERFARVDRAPIRG